MVEITIAKTEDDLHRILVLEAQNLTKNISEAVQKDQGFVTFQYSYQQMKAMADVAPQIIAKDGDEVVGYALTTLPSLGEAIPMFAPMFTLLQKLSWNNQPVYDYRFYAMGQICVADGYRGQGIFDAMYAKHKEILSENYDLCITEVAIRNARSMRAHERVGFKTIHTYEDSADIWNVVVWDWS